MKKIIILATVIISALMITVTHATEYRMTRKPLRNQRVIDKRVVKTIDMNDRYELDLLYDNGLIRLIGTPKTYEVTEEVYKKAKKRKTYNFSLSISDYATKEGIYIGTKELVDVITDIKKL